VDIEQAQKNFARWIDLGTRVGLALLAAGFAAYVGGLLPPHVPLSQLAGSWHLPLAQFVAATGAPTGWQWLELAGRGDYFNFVGIVLLASIIIAAYLRVLSLVARKDRAFALIAALEIIVLLAAASGLLNSFGGGIS
jgi:type IV secretory pathway VirB2 component (pilin)